jgi:hypothetical protein
LVHFRAALGMAYLIGARAVRSPVADRLDQQSRNARAARARLAKRPASAQVNAIIGELARPYWEQQPPLGDYSIANRILPRANKRFAREQLNSLGVDAVYKRLKGLHPKA